MKRKNNGPPERSFFRVMGAMLRIAQRANPRVFLAYILTSTAFTALLVAELHLIRVLLDRLPLFVEGQISYQILFWTILTLGGISILWILMNAGMNLSYEYLASLSNARMTEAMSEKASRLELIQFESTELYDGIEKAHKGRSRGFDAMEALLFSLIFHGGYFLFLGIYLIELEPLILLGVFAAFLPVAFSRWIRASVFYRTENRVAPLRREFNHYEACLTDRTYFKETRTTGAVPFFRRKYDQTLAAYNHEMWRTELRMGVIDLALKVLTLAGYIGLLFMLIRFVILGRISAGLFGAMYFTMDSIFKWFDELFDRLGYAYENAAFGANYLSFLNRAERGGGEAVLPRDRGLHLRDVSFRYPGTAENAVDSVTLTIQPGESVAIVGENGAGKSSLVRLIAGLYQPDSGSITAGGVDLRESTDETRFQRLSAVFQTYQRYHMTLLDNVRVAEPQEGVSRDRVGREPIKPGGGSLWGPAAASPVGMAARDRAASALNQAGFYERYGVKNDLDLDTMLSREFGGIDLSGGEWQRVAIARGLYRPHDTIILDEPTASIDPIEEDRVYRMFLESARGKIAIIVTHRLGLARIADRIIVMAGGRIVQEGTHTGLITAEGPYARMFHAQAAWYQRDLESIT